MSQPIKRLQALFTSSLSSVNLSLEISSVADDALSEFAASFPSGGMMGGHHSHQEAERFRLRWRQGLIEIWNAIEPVPGSETDLGSLAITQIGLDSIVKVSNFLILLEKLSAGLGEDDDSALISKRDIGAIWWDSILRRTLLGTAQESITKLKPSLPLKPESIRPLVTSTVALQATTAMVIWAMSPSMNAPDHLMNIITPFGLVIFTELEERAKDMLKGQNEGYGVRNLEECIIGWGASCPKAFFLHLSPLLTHAAPLPFLSLLLAFLSRHSAKAYHALQTPLLQQLIANCENSKGVVQVGLGIKCLSIFLVTLPVIIGSKVIFGVMRVFGRVVCWEEQDLNEQESSRVLLDPPDPMVLFTVLYGLYPCNFLAFLSDAATYLQVNATKSNKGEKDTEEVDLGFDSASIRERSKHLIRSHTLHPALLATNLESELTDTTRWRQFESADVMAECDRNVAHFGTLTDPRGEVILDIPEEEAEASYFDFNSSPRLKEESLPLVEHQRVAELSSPHLSTRSRSSIPHLPSTTHFNNFQALQSSPRRAGSTFSDSADPLSLSAQLGMSVSPIGSISSSTATSRRGSFSNNPSTAYMSRTNSNMKLTDSNNEKIVRLETELILLKSEVNFQLYLKSLHLAHMGTLHREKVLDSGIEAERQSLYRTIRTLRASSKSTQTTLDKLRLEAGATKLNWIQHLDDLKEKLKSLREGRLVKEEENVRLMGELKEVKALVVKQGKELEEEGAAFFDLKNQVSLDAEKLERIVEYETRIEALMKTLAICDEDLCKFVEQRNQMNSLVSEWKKSELLLESSQAECLALRQSLQAKQNEILSIKSIKPATEIVQMSKRGVDDSGLMRIEMERLRERVAALEEENIELKGSSL